MKTFNEFITEASGDKAAYQKFFNSMLKKFGVKSASELDDKKKKEFYDAIDAGWEADNESITEKSKYTITTNPKKLSDDDLMDFYDWLENMKDPNPDNEDQRKKALAACKKEMKKRRFMNYT